MLNLLLNTGIELLELHGPDGQIAYVNTHEISTLRQPTAADLKQHFTSGAHCIVVTTNGKFIAVVESCPKIRDMILERNNAKQKQSTG